MRRSAAKEASKAAVAKPPRYISLERIPTPEASNHPPTSWLDKLQKEAQSSELDYTNSSPGFFVVVSLLQVPAALALSSLARVHRDVRLCGRPSHRSSAVGRLGSEELFARRVGFDGTRTVEPCATATTANASRRCDSGPETRGDPNRARLRAQHEPDLVAGV